MSELPRIHRDPVEFTSKSTMTIEGNLLEKNTGLMMHLSSTDFETEATHQLPTYPLHTKSQEIN